MPFVSRSLPMEKGSSPGKMAQGLRLLIITDPRCVNEPLHPNRFDSWGTVYGYFIVRSLQQHGAYVEMESIDEAVRGTFPRIRKKHLFDHAIFVINRVSELYTPELFDNVRMKLKPNGKLFSLADDDSKIIHEDFRFCATIIHPDHDSEKKKQIFWGVDESIFHSEKDPNTLRILLDTWHFDERKWDRTREILQSAISNFELIDLNKSGKKDLEIIAWGQDGPEIFSYYQDIDNLVRIPPRIRFEDMVNLLSSTDIFMVTHSESMGLTILEAAASGCLVAIPVPSEGEEEIGHFIKEDLASTIPHFEYPINEEILNPPWDEMLEHLNPDAIRQDSIDLNWYSVARRMIHEFGSGTVSSSQAAETNNFEYLFDDRSRMISSKKLISETTPSPESISDFIINWYNHYNFDEDCKSIFFTMLEDSIPDDLEYGLWFRDYCLQVYSMMTNLGVKTLLVFENIGGTLPDVGQGLNHISSILDDFKDRKEAKDVSEGELREAVFSNLRELMEYDMLRFMLNSSGDKTWSLGRIVENFYSQDIEMLDSILSNCPDQLDIWKIKIRGLWNGGNHVVGVKVANEALKYHPNDSWLQEIANRSV